MQAGDAIPELKVTPDKYLTVRYAGASGDFNPIHIDEDFAKQVGLPGRILHGLWTMAQVARAQTEAGGGPHSLRRLQVQFRGMGLPEHEVTVTGTVHEVARRRRGRAHRGRAGRQGDHPQRRGRDRGRVAAPTYNRCGADAAPRADPAQARRGPHRDRRARGLEDPGRRPRPRLRRRRRSATSWRCSRSTACSRTRTRAPGACRPTPGTASTSIACCAARTSSRASARLDLQLVRREVDEAMRATTETLSQVTNLLAIVSAPPIDTATIRHVEVLLLQPQVLMVVVITSTGGVTKKVLPFERPVDPGLAGVGRRVPQRAPGGRQPRRAHAALEAQRPARSAPPSAASSSAWRPPSPSWPTPPRTRSTSAAPPGCCPSTASRTSPRSTSSWASSSAAWRCSTSCAPPSASATCSCASATRTSCRRCTRWPSSPPATGCPRATWAPSRSSGRCAWTTRGAIRTVREAAHQLSRFIEDVYEG